ncbi:MAG TPA: NAD-dependent epimerase/dehydratase family protein [Bryobacteraceae bacterium]|jgi:UDP-glucose 4-epimerase|nr:NAD-dependent epimerase/dehydratase family protein [Bryobacteraceae bacterium]
MKSALVTGGSGFFGGILKRKLLDMGVRVINVDLHVDEDKHPELTSIQGDIRNRELMDRVYRETRFDAVFHCAAMLAHAVEDKNLLWTSNVDGTRIVAEGARNAGVQSLMFTSSNCLWGRGFDHPLTEDEPPAPIEIYGRSKWEGEQILREFARDMNVLAIRCPTIIDFGRLGLLAMLFEFIDEGRRVWTLGGGTNRYQFIYAQDLASACIRGASHTSSEVLNIGSDNVKSFAETYQYVIDRAGTGAKVANLPKGPALAAMKVAYHLGLSPLGPYQYKMIAENFLFDTTRIKSRLGWTPTLTNEEMLWRAYQYYHEHRREIERRTDVSAHKQAAKMGVIRMLKWVS